MVNTHSTAEMSSSSVVITFFLEQKFNELEFFNENLTITIMEEIKNEFMQLWNEYESKIAKLETNVVLLQHHFECLNNAKSRKMMPMRMNGIAG